MEIVEFFGKYILVPLIAAFVGSFLTGKIIWKWQKKKEIKYRVYEDAVKAIALHFVDSLDLKLQSEKPTYKGQYLHVYRRPETNALIETTRHMVRAYFSDAAYKAFIAAVNSPVSIETIPNLEASQKHEKAITILIEELE